MNYFFHIKLRPLVADTCSIVVTVAILAQGNNWIMRSRNPFSAFRNGFDSDRRNIFYFLDDH